MDPHVFAVLVLRGLGLRVLEQGTGDEELARREDPDLVLLDAVLPDLSGLEVAPALADDPATADARVVIASSLVRSDDRGASARRARLPAQAVHARPAGRLRRVGVGPAGRPVTGRAARFRSAASVL